MPPMPAAASGRETQVKGQDLGPLSESVALVPVCSNRKAYCENATTWGRTRPSQPAAPGADRQRMKISLDRYLFAICRRDEVCSDCGLVRPFPHRNGIMAESPVGIGVRHNDRTLEGIPVLP
jgi:hypothetical protein